MAVTADREPARVLVLGAGFIGAHVTRRLVADGHQVDVLTRSEPAEDLAHLLDGASVVIGDVSTMSSMPSLLTQIDHVVYAVGSSSPAESDLDPASDVAVVIPPVIRLLELLRLRPSVGLTYLSSGGAVYGQVEDVAHEATPTEPISSYGILKQTVEQYVKMYSSVHGVSARILRVSNVYGPGQPWARGQGIVARLMRCTVTGDRFPIFGAGDNVRDFVFVEDVAGVVSDLIRADAAHTVFNVGSGVGHSIIDIVRAVETVSGLKINVDYHDARPFDVRSIVLDIGRIRETVPYRPIELRDGIARTWRAFAPTGSHEAKVGRIHLPGGAR